MPDPALAARHTGDVPAIEPPTLRDGDLTLRPPRPADAHAVTAACQDAAIQRWVGVPSPYRREHADAWLASCPARARAGEAVTLLAEGGDGRLAGSFSLLGARPRPGLRRDRVLGRSRRARARGRDPVGGVLRDGPAAALRLRTIEILVDRDNAPSRAVRAARGLRATPVSCDAPARGPGPPP